MTGNPTFDSHADIIEYFESTDQTLEDATYDNYSTILQGTSSITVEGSRENEDGDIILRIQESGSTFGTTIPITKFFDLLVSGDVEVVEWEDGLLDGL